MADILKMAVSNTFSGMKIFELQIDSQRCLFNLSPSCCMQYSNLYYIILIHVITVSGPVWFFSITCLYVEEYSTSAKEGNWLYRLDCMTYLAYSEQCILGVLNLLIQNIFECLMNFFFKSLMSHHISDISKKPGNDFTSLPHKLTMGCLLWKFCIKCIVL